jgi:hypothetical protein
MSAIGLPVGWVKKRSTHKNKSYYFNLDNGHTQWTHPSDGIRDENGKLERLKPLADGWYTEYCPLHKLWYYYQIDTNHSQWTHPSYGMVYDNKTEKNTDTYEYAEFTDTYGDDDYSNYGYTYDSY